jgi:hypothetical protein
MRTLLLFFAAFLFSGCETNQTRMQKIIFLHHSTGEVIWKGRTNKYIYKLIKKSDVKAFFRKYNNKNGTRYYVAEEAFPVGSEYGWKNYPFDYYNIWVKHAGENPHMGEATLEILTKKYNIIIFKHCYPVSDILEDTGSPDIESEEKRIENYKLQYTALKEKMHQFPDNKFIVWTPAVHVKNLITPEKAERTRLFYNWMNEEWDEKGDNIYLWDFYNYETEGGLYLLDKYATGTNNSHPNRQFGARIAPLFARFVIDVAEGKVE